MRAEYKIWKYTRARMHVRMTTVERGESSISKICLFVRNVPYNTTDSQLEDAFKAYGPLRACYTVKDKGGVHYYTLCMCHQYLHVCDYHIHIHHVVSGFSSCELSIIYVW